MEKNKSFCSYLITKLSISSIDRKAQHWRPGDMRFWGHTYNHSPLSQLTDIMFTIYKFSLLSNIFSRFSFSSLHTTTKTTAILKAVLGEKFIALTKEVYIYWSSRRYSAFEVVVRSSSSNSNITTLICKKYRNLFSDLRRDRSKWFTFDSTALWHH